LQKIVVGKALRRDKEHIYITGKYLRPDLCPVV
jgi:hypothetical protein